MQKKRGRVAYVGPKAAPSNQSKYREQARSSPAAFELCVKCVVWRGVGVVWVGVEEEGKSRVGVGVGRTSIMMMMPREKSGCVALCYCVICTRGATTRLG